MGRAWRAIVLSCLIFAAAAAASSVSADPGFSLVPGSPFQCCGDPSTFIVGSAVFNRDGRFVAFAGSTGHGFRGYDVWLFAVASDGTLTAQRGSVGGTSASFSPSADLLATACAVGGLTSCPGSPSNSVSVFKVAADGSLTIAPGSPYSSSNAPTATAFSSGGLLAMTSGNTVAVYTVGSDGSLSPVAGSPFATGASPDSVAFAPSGNLVATRQRRRQHRLGL
jgi:hypothetical protein